MTRFTRTAMGILSLALTLSLTILGTPALATTIDDGSNPGSEPDLYEIFNAVFCTEYASSQQLFADRGVPEGHDWLWRVEGEGRLRVTFRYSSAVHELGIGYNPGVTLVPSVPSGADFHCVDIDYPYENVLGDPVPFPFFIRSGETRWSSLTPTASNPGYLDHFVALDASDLCYPGHRGSEYIYVLAFEDQHLGDRDYQDVIAIVENVRPIPEPATMLLIGAGGVGLFFRRRAAKGLV